VESANRPKLLKVAEFAAPLRLSHRVIYDYVDRGLVRAVRIGKTLRIPETELDRLLAQADVSDAA
jgi:excisionase family DNA binding protein